MTQPTADETLGDIVTANPASARVLEGFALDYCCGGGRTLAEACAQSDTDPAAVLDALAGVDAEAEPAADWAAMGPADLVDHLEATHHAYLHTELERLAALVDKVAGVHGANHPELLEVQSTYRALRDDLEPHLMKEERVLFPMIRDLADSQGSRGPDGEVLLQPIRVMMSEHDLAGELLATLRHQTGGYRTPDDGCGSYQALYDGLAQLERDTHLHVHKENNLLFPAVATLDALPPGNRVS